MSTTTQKKYKATFLLDTRNYQDPVEKLIEKITATIESIGGSVKKIDNLGMRNFTRVVDRNYTAGIFLDIDIEGEPALPAALQEKFRLDRLVNRILVVSA